VWTRGPTRPPSRPRTAKRVKQTHPDTEGGDEEAFKKVNKAYERLSD
jgi:curved DNA-binding protein CbpA